MRLNTEKKYKYVVFEGCTGSTIEKAVVRYFQENNPEVKLSNFEQLKENGLDSRVWVKYINRSFYN